MGFKIKKTVNGETVWEPIKAKKYTASKITEYTGSLPISINADGNALLDYRIYGNTEQTGTPTPENPIIPIGCGERTENLFKTESNMLSSSNWDLNPKYNAKFYFVNYKLSDAVTQELKKGQHTCSIFRHFTDGYTPDLLVCAFTQTPTPTVDLEYRILTNYGVTYTRTFDFSQWQDIYLIIGYGNGFSTEEEKQSKIDELFANWEISIVAGSTAPESYEPYGYKLPILSNTVVTSIYLGEVESTRRIKKLVLTGTSTDGNSNVTAQGVIFITPTAALKNVGAAYCTHFEYVDQNQGSGMPNNSFTTSGGAGTSLWFKIDYTTIADFKSYLAAQYAAGTPVTVWYVLKEPETGTFNEPLMKIGDHADTIDSTQSTAQIPTSKGTNIIDYDGTTKPSQMYIKYNSWSGWSDIDNYKMNNGNWTQEMT